MTSLSVPPGFNESEVLKTIEEVVRQLAAPFRFGYNDVSDMKQEGRIYALEALASGKFDASRGTLRVFLTNVVRNRFINLKRNKFERRNPPCSSCPFYNKIHDLCGAFQTREECNKWNAWKARNLAKRSLMDGHNPNDTAENTPEELPVEGPSIESMANKEIADYVDKNIPVEHRADYCRMLSGVKLPKHRREKILEVVTDIVKGKFGDGET